MYTVEKTKSEGLSNLRRKHVQGRPRLVRRSSKDSLSSEYAHADAAARIAVAW
jgi:hypothetical protein